MREGLGGWVEGGVLPDLGALDLGSGRAAVHAFCGRVRQAPCSRVRRPQIRAPRVELMLLVPGLVANGPWMSEIQALT